MKKFIVKIIIGVVIIAVAGVGLALFTRIWDPFWNPFRPSPREVLKETSARFEELKTFHFDVYSEKIVNQPQQETVKRSMMVNGDLDYTNKEEIKWEGGTKLETDFEEGQFSLGWEKIIIGENSWFKLTILPSSRFSELFTFDLEKIKDQWIKLEKESFGDLFGKLSPQAEKEVIQKMISNEKFFHFKKLLPDEEINGKQTYHYLFFLDEEELKKLLPEISELLPFEVKELEEFKGVKVEVWIGQEDKLLYKAKLESEVGILAGKIEIYLSEFNKSLKIEPPQWFELFEGIFGTKDFNFFSFPSQP